MHQVGDTYVDNKTNMAYKCTSIITISPTLMRPNQSKTTTWKHVYSVGGENGEPAKTIVLEDEEGNRLIAVLVDEEVDFTATANDIREGKVAATDDGVTIGNKFIPSYVVTEGTRVITKGEAFSIKIVHKDDLYDYTKLQAFLCPFNKNLNNSVSCEKVVINDNVYDVLSTVSVSEIKLEAETKSILLGIENTSTTPYVIRFITYKEVY